ncbi:MAG: hypothetical protein ACOVNZ_00420 [Crocinitomicaceae bacterium]
MKVLVTCALLIFTACSLNGQINSYKWHTYAKFSSGKIDSSIYYNGGISAEYMLFKNLGLNYNFEFQHRSDNYNHLHGSIGSLGGPVIFALGAAAGLANLGTNSNSNIGLWGMLAGVLVAVMPEGISYHVPIGYKGDIAPYANFLGFDWVRNREIGYSEFKYACSFGVRGTYLVHERITALGFVETRKCAPTGWGIGAGIGMGYLFKLRETGAENKTPN